MTSTKGMLRNVTNGAPTPVRKWSRGLGACAVASLCCGALGLAACSASSSPRHSSTAAAGSDISVPEFALIQETFLSGEPVPLSRYLGQVVLVSNLSFKCGTTPQLSALEQLFQEYQAQGLVVLGVPSSDFTGEDMSDHSAIKSFCSKRFGVTFPLLEPAPIVGEHKRPLFRLLTEGGGDRLNGEVSFNLEKFLIDRHGKPRYRFGPFTSATSSQVRDAVRELLAETKG